MSDYYPSLEGQLELPIFGRGPERPTKRKDAPAAGLAAKPVGVQHHLGDLDAAASDVSVPCDPQERRSGAIVTGPRPSITGATSSQPAQGGLDWLGVSAQLRWTCPFASLWARLLEAREDRRQGGDGIFKLPDGSCCQVRAAGATAGIVRCEVVLEWADTVVLLEGRELPFDTRANCFVRISGKACLIYGARPAWCNVVQLLEQLGAELVAAVPSRADLCVDLPGQEMKPFIEAWMNDAVITRAHKQRPTKDRRTWTGLEMGFGSNVMCRIYDKAVEATDEATRAVLVERRWEGQEQEHATRVEFQLQREALRNRFDVNSMEDLWDRLPQIAEWLTSDWLRFTTASVDYANKHQSRAVTSEVWEKIQAKFCAVFGPVECWHFPALPCCPAPLRLWRQALGCASSAIARSCESIENVDEFLDVLELELRAVVHALKDEILEAVQRKAVVHRARSALRELGKIPIPY